MKNKLLLLTRLRNRYLLAADCLILCLTPLLAMWLRTEKLIAVRELALPLAVFTPSMVVLKACTFYATGLYAQYWPYASENELKVLFRATVMALVAEMVLFFGLLLPTRLIPDAFPRSLPILDAIFTLLAIGGLRLAMRMITTIGNRTGEARSPRNVLIVGAGVAGMMVAKELEQNPHLGIVPAGFVDDDPGKLNKMIHGLPVLGTLHDLPFILRAQEFDQVIVAMPTAPGNVVRRVATVCAEAGVESKTIPGLYEILRGTARVDQFRSIQLEDLLRRGTIKTDTERVVALVRNACVMITGAGGSIGAEIARQVQDAGPAAIILVGHGENSIFAIARELKSRARSNMRIVAAVGDIRDRRRMGQIFGAHRPELVFHAAAHKHVGLMQHNVSEAVTNNVLGTRNLLELCEKHHTARFVMISTDKAVNPT
ncbi:MAG TPA: polysaccharide biosynthesis protein, partial [Bacteroidota bacterium]